MKVIDHKLPPAMQAKAVAYLRSKMDAETLAYLRDFHARCPDWHGDETPPEERERFKAKYDGFYIPTPFHFSTGMSVRNVLRGVFSDDELPPITYDHYDPPIEAQNWDDYYIAVLEEAIQPTDGPGWPD